MKYDPLDMAIIFIGIPIIYLLLSKVPIILGWIVDRIAGPSTRDIPDKHVDRQEIAKYKLDQENTINKAAGPHFQQGRR